MVDTVASDLIANSPVAGHIASRRRQLVVALVVFAALDRKSVV